MAANTNPSGTAAFRFDVIAGLTAAAVVLPKAMAYATVAGLPVAIGLYTAFIPMLVYALLGSSRVLSVSSTATLAILTATQLGLVVPDGNAAQLVTATATLAALVGAMLLLARLLKLGFVANFISWELAFLLTRRELLPGQTDVPGIRTDEPGPSQGRPWT